MTMQSMTSALPVMAGRATQATARKPLLRRILDALMEAQMRRAEREVAEFLRTRGWNDQTERELERRLWPR